MCRKFRFNLYAGSVLASTIALVVVLVWAGASRAATAGPTAPELEKQFSGAVRPFMQSYCVSCHGKEKPAAQLDLTAFTSMESVAEGLSPLVPRAGEAGREADAASERRQAALGRSSVRRSSPGSAPCGCTSRSAMPETPARCWRAA